MALDKIDHIGIAVRDLEKSIEAFENLLGTKCFKIERVEGQGVTTAFFKVGDIKLELVCPLSENHSLHNFLEKRGEGMHHLAFQVSSLEEEIRDLVKKGFSPLGAENSIGAEGKKIRFLEPHFSGKVLVEICAD